MKRIFKTWKKATYFKGMFELRDENKNWASPITFPTVFTAYGAGIRNGNWQSCTSINTATWVIDNYFDTIGHDEHDVMYKMWVYCKELSTMTWGNVENNKDKVMTLIDLANTELSKLKILV